VADSCALRMEEGRGVIKEGEDGGNQYCFFSLLGREKGRRGEKKKIRSNCACWTDPFMNEPPRRREGKGMGGREPRFSTTFIGRGEGKMRSSHCELGGGGKKAINIISLKNP